MNNPPEFKNEIGWHDGNKANAQNATIIERTPKPNSVKVDDGKAASFQIKEVDGGWTAIIKAPCCVGTGPLPPTDPPDVDIYFEIPDPTDEPYVIPPILYVPSVDLTTMEPKYISPWTIDNSGFNTKTDFSVGIGVPDGSDPAVPIEVYVPSSGAGGGEASRISAGASNDEAYSRTYRGGSAVFRHGFLSTGNQWSMEDETDTGNFRIGSASTPGILRVDSANASVGINAAPSADYHLFIGGPMFASGLSDFTDVALSGDLNVDGTSLLGGNVTMGGSYMRPPILTNTARDALVPSEGWTVYSSTDNQMQTYDGAAWLSAGGSPAGAVPVTSINNDYLTGVGTVASPLDVDVDAVSAYAEGVINHNSLTGYVAAEHLNWTSPSVGTVDATNIPDLSGTYQVAGSYQPLDADLTAIAELVSAADKLPYFTGAGTASVTTLTTAARSVLDDATTGAMLTTLGAATAAQGALADSSLQSGDIGTNVQAYNANLTTWQGYTAPSGTVVGTTDPQTLTQKTLTTPIITLPINATPTVDGLIGWDGTEDAITIGNGTVTKKLRDWSDNVSAYETIHASNIPDLSGTYQVAGSYQPLDADLTAIAELVSAADKLPYFTGAGTASVTTLTTAARSVLDDATTGAMLTTLGAATAAQGALADSSLQSGDIGTNVQAYNANLTTWQGYTAPSGTVVGTTDPQTLTQKTLTTPIITLPINATPTVDGLIGWDGTEDAITIGNGTVTKKLRDWSDNVSAYETIHASNIPDLSGTYQVAGSYQPLDADLTAIAELVSAADKLPYFTGAGTASVTTLTTAARSVLDDATTGAMLTTLGAATAAQGALADSSLQSGDIGTNVQAYNANLTTWQGKTAPSGTVADLDDIPTTLGDLGDVTVAPTTGDFLKYSGSGWTEGVITTGDVPSLDASKISTGTFATTFIPSLDASKIATGVIPIARGGTNAVTAADARVELGVEIGADVQSYHPNLTSWQAKTVPTGTVVGTSDTQTITSKIINPRQLTTTGRDALGWNLGDTIYNTTAAEWQTYNGSAWRGMDHAGAGYLDSGDIGSTVQAYYAQLDGWAQEALSGAGGSRNVRDSLHWSGTGWAMRALAEADIPSTVIPSRSSTAVTGGTTYTPAIASNHHRTFVATITGAGDVDVAEPTTALDGNVYTLRITRDSTQNLTWNAKWEGEPTFTSGTALTMQFVAFTTESPNKYVILSSIET
jgi:uncharacterized metal-binding protein